MNRLAVVLYEDQRALGAREFPPHDLVLACVADRVPGWTVWELRKVVPCLPLKGNNKVLAACREEVGLIAPRGEPVYAFLDSDRLPDLLGLDRSACRRSILDAFEERSQQGVELVILEDRLERIIEAIRFCQGFGTGAAAKQSLNDRDIEIARVAHGRTAELRKCVAMRVPGLGRLIDRVEACVSGMGA